MIAKRTALIPSLLLALAACSNDLDVTPRYTEPTSGEAPTGTESTPIAPAGTSTATSPSAPAQTAAQPATPTSTLPTATTISGPIWLREPISNRAAPLSRGTLTVTPDETTAIAADPDRDAVFVVDLRNDSVVTLDTEPEIGLGQVVAGEAGVAFVAARQSGQVLRIDLNQARIDATFEVCGSPQGLAVDDSTDRLHVACRDGSLVTLNASTGEVERTLTLDDDLRDVLVRGDGLVVTRFRSAEILLLDASGQEVLRMKPAIQGAQVAWRTLLTDEGDVLVAYQSNSTFALPGNNYYGTSCGASLSQPTLTELDPAKNATVSQMALVGAAGVVDVALDPTTTGRVVAVVPGNALAVEPLEALFEVEMGSGTQTPCKNGDTLEHPLPEVPVSIAVGQSGARYVLTREPATLQVIGERTIVLSDESREDTGFRMFHMNSGLNVACASCHPGGREDGYTWQFREIGNRRTQSLEGGISQLAPFHWEGDLPTLGDFVSEVMARRMGLEVMPDDREVAALADFLDRVPLPPQRAIVDPVAVERGRALFFDPTVACASCHSGERFSDNAAYDVGTGGLFITPPLVRVSQRAPFMHDGCALTLLDRFSVCGGGDRHGKTSELSEAQVLDLVAFLESL